MLLWLKKVAFSTLISRVGSSNLEVLVKWLAKVKFYSQKLALVVQMNPDFRVLSHLHWPCQIRVPTIIQDRDTLL